jgi:hypothetical protein
MKLMNRFLTIPLIFFASLAGAADAPPQPKVSFTQQQLDQHDIKISKIAVARFVEQQANMDAVETDRLISAAFPPPEPPPMSLPRGAKEPAPTPPK